MDRLDTTRDLNMARERTRDRSTTRGKTRTIKVAIRTRGTATGKTRTITRIDPTMTDAASDESTTINRMAMMAMASEGIITATTRRSRVTRAVIKQFQYLALRKIAQARVVVCPSALPRKDQELVAQ